MPASARAAVALRMSAGRLVGDDRLGPTGGAEGVEQFPGEVLLGRSGRSTGRPA